MFDHICVGVCNIVGNKYLLNKIVFHTDAQGKRDSILYIYFCTRVGIVF